MKIVKIPVKEFGSEASRQKGSHAILKKESCRKIVTVIPLHSEVKKGTLLGILRLAEISKEDFLKKIVKR